MQKLLFSALTSFLLVATVSVQAQTLKGSKSSINKQYQTAIAYGYTFLETSNTLNQLVDNGELVRVQRSAHLDLHDVSYPYARSDVKLFLDRLSAQYHSACGEKLVVTSLSRPLDKQPANAATNSVHPTGMAVDLRIPSHSRCRSWLEQTLLSLEAADVLDVTRERRPPHYHVAVFTKSYASYLAARNQTPHEYIVRPGDSLWLISARTGASVAQLRAANGLSSDLINVGQRLQVPGGGNSNRATTTASLSEPVRATSQINHQVRRGDTLWRLANRYGTTVDQIQQANGLSGTNLKIGQILQIQVVSANI